MIKKYFTEEEKRQAARENHRRWAQRNKERRKEYKRFKYLNGTVPWRIKQRELILTAYGRKCARCGNDDIRVLDLDHVNGDGAAHRKKVSSWKVYGEVISTGFPDNFRLLCKNCNWLAWLEIKPPATTL